MFWGNRLASQPHLPHDDLLDFTRFWPDKRTFIDLYQMTSDSEDLLYDTVKLLLTSNTLEPLEALLSEGLLKWDQTYACITCITCIIIVSLVLDSLGTCHLLIWCVLLIQELWIDYLWTTIQKEMVSGPAKIIRVRLVYCVLLYREGGHMMTIMFIFRTRSVISLFQFWAS